jgi:excisionase family DNA binding protein
VQLGERLNDLLKVPAIIEELSERLHRLEGEIQILQQGDPEELLVADQAAKLLGMSEGAVRQAAWRGRLPSVRHGGRLRFRRGDLLALRKTDT